MLLNCSQVKTNYCEKYVGDVEFIFAVVYPNNYITNTHIHINIYSVLMDSLFDDIFLVKTKLKIYLIKVTNSLKFLSKSDKCLIKC